MESTKLTRQQFIEQIKANYPAGFSQDEKNHERRKQSSVGKYQYFELAAFAKSNGDSIHLFSSLQGGNGLHFIVQPSLSLIEKGSWQKSFENLDEALTLYSELIGEPAIWYKKIKRTFKAKIINQNARN